MNKKELFKVLGAILMFAVITVCLYGCKNKSRLQSSIPITTRTALSAESSVMSTKMVLDEEAEKYLAVGPVNQYIKIGDKIYYYNSVENSAGPNEEEYLVYTVTAINIYDHIDSFDNWVGDPGKRYIRNGKLSRHYKFVVVDLDVSCSDLNRYSTNHDLETVFSLYSDDAEQTPGIWYFEINPDRRMGPYGYMLQSGESEHFKIGFLCPTKALENNKAYIKANSGYYCYFLKINNN